MTLQMQLNQEQLKQIFNARKTLSEMLHDRGYQLLTNYNNKSQKTLKRVYEETLSSFSSAVSYAGQCRFSVQNEQEKIMIQFLEGPTYDFAGLGDIKHIILIAGSKLNVSQTQKLENASLQHSIKLEIFLLEELQFNITKHFSVPKHIVLSKEKKRKMLIDKQIDPDNIPVIKKTDPVARYLGLVANDIVLIKQKTEEYGTYINFRICK